MAETEGLIETSSPIQSAMGEEDIIQIVAMHKWYGEFHCLKNINLPDDAGHRHRAAGYSGYRQFVSGGYEMAGAVDGSLRLCRNFLLH